MRKSSRTEAARWRRAPVGAMVRVALAAVAAVGAAVVTATVPALHQNVFSLFLVIILASGLAGGLAPGAAASLASAASIAFFVLDPALSFGIAAAPDRVRAALLLAAGLVITLLSEALRSARRRVAERERALEESEESYRSLFDQSADALFILDRAGRIVEANPAAATMFDRPVDRMVGCTPGHLSDPERTDYDAEIERLERVFAGEPQRLQWWGLRDDGHAFPMEVALSEARYFGRTVALAVARDLTERRELEAQLRQSQKMEAVGRLAGGVSHDFNNLLTTIRGHAALMDEALPPNHVLRADLREIDRASDLATHVTRQLLTFSRSETDAEPRPIELNPVIEGLEKMLRRVIGTDISIDLHLHPGTGSVRMDPGQLEQVVLNLVVNATDAMPDGGVITIRTDPLDRVGDGDGPGVELSVRDTGVGMDEATAQRVFEPFFTTKSREEGTGLGLSTVYGIVRQCRGTIGIDTAPGAGTAFRLELPAAGPESRAPAEVASTPASERPGAGRGETLLLVEDEAPVRRLMTTVLERAGYTVLAAGSAAEAGQRLGGVDPAPALLITDVSLPGESGPQLAARLRARRPDLPVLFASGSDGLAPDAPELVDPVHFLRKPFTPAELTDAVARLLRRRAPVPVA